MKNCNYPHNFHNNYRQLLWKVKHLNYFTKSSNFHNYAYKNRILSTCSTKKSMLDPTATKRIQYQMIDKVVFCEITWIQLTSLKSDHILHRTQPDLNPSQILRCRIRLNLDPSWIFKNHRISVRIQIKTP